MKISVGVIGLGYVGLPLAISFSKKYQVFGFDISKDRIDELARNFDRTLEITSNTLKKSKIHLSSSIDDLTHLDFYIITVPTPVDRYNKPDLDPLKSACRLVAKVLKKKSIIVFESTVFPGCTEDICIPLIENESNLKLNKDFFVGYSPERINPGDKLHTFEKITKVISGSDKKSTNAIYDLYSNVINAPVFKAKSIKVAEASKVIENTQRDINIALMNELSDIFNKMNINTFDVLKAASTKWNFLKFRPGLVGGHCIGVDPYYLSFKAKKLGINPKIILSGREINNRVSTRIVENTLGRIRLKNKFPKILILGLSFKENCPDLRNSGSLKVLEEFNKYNIKPSIHDPYYQTDPNLKLEYRFISDINKIRSKFDCVLVLTPHDYYLNLTDQGIRNLVKKKGHVFDMVNLFNQSDFISL